MRPGMTETGKTKTIRATGLSRARRWRPFIVLAFIAAITAYGVSGCDGTEEEPAANVNETVNVNEQEALPANLANAITKNEESDDGGEYSRFTHSSDYHSKLPCLACHTRESNASRISFPGRVDHSPCAGCHTQQFANKNSSICTICHTDRESGSLRSFPPLRSFGARFSHARHVRTSCGTCHKPAGKTLSIPAGSTAHATCFQCHSSNASNAMANCGLCHQPGSGRMKVPGRSRAFAANFSHAKHGTPQNLNCRSCHTVFARASGSKQVSAPATAMHFAKPGVTSCASCHNNERAFGGDDFADCKRCHQGSNFSF